MRSQKQDLQPGEAPRITIDGAYFRAQALEAVRTFTAPLQGVFAAAARDPSASKRSLNEKKVS